uniref:Uncharacterized protein n=1 Tax=Arundo donax TaxID=35708 RepID=A0A0A9CSX4_ARUDO
MIRKRSATQRDSKTSNERNKNTKRDGKTSDKHVKSTKTKLQRTIIVLEGIQDHIFFLHMSTLADPDSTVKLNSSSDRKHHV